MAEDNRAQWIAILEAAAQRLRSQMNDEWGWLLDQLKLPPKYFLAVYEALRQGRWRKAKNPRSYLKTVAKRESVKSELLSDGTDSFVLVDPNILDVISHERGSSEAIKSTDGIWRRGEGWDDYDYDDPRSGFASYREFLMSSVPHELTIVTQPSKGLKKTIDEINERTDEFHIHLKPDVRPNWKEWARIAGLSEWEQVVLEYRCAGKSRDKALSEQPDEQSRKALQAAWRKFDRTGMERLRTAIEKNRCRDVPK